MNTKRIFGIVAIAATLFSVTACGGGKKSGLKNNEYLGSLPALYADNELTETALKEKAKKITESGNFKKMMKAAAEEAKKAAEQATKFEAAKNAEWEKINGKDIPFTYSEAFEN